MRVLIIADDLTGALDSAVTFTGAGLRCVVARRPGDVAAAARRRPDVLSVSTASREGNVAAARAAVAAALDAVGALPEIVFKKVNSRLKGHVAGEVGVFAARAGRSRALVAPAIPAQGRTVVNGRLTGTGVTQPIDVAATVAASGLALEVPDTRVDADFDGPLGGALDRAAGASRRGRRARGGRRAPSGARARRRSRRRGSPGRSCSRSARTIRSPSPRSSVWQRAALQLSRRRRTGCLPSVAGWRSGAGPAHGSRGQPFDPRAAGERFARRHCATCQGAAGSGRCSAAAVRRRTPSSARSASAF